MCNTSYRTITYDKWVNPMKYNDNNEETFFLDGLSEEDINNFSSYDLSDLEKYMIDKFNENTQDGDSLWDDEPKAEQSDNHNSKAKNDKKSGVKINSVHKGHRERVLQKFINHGFVPFTDYEVLEFLLFYAIPYKDTNVLAHRLIDKFGSIKAVMEAEHFELASVNGIGDRAAALIVMLRELYKYISTSQYTNDILYTSEVSGEFCINYFKNHVEENFILISTDLKRRIKCIDVISRGNETETAFYPRNVVKAVVKNRAACVILAHNHPGNNAEPSSNDLIITEKIANLLRGLGVTVIDHIICSGNKYISFSDKGYLKN